MRAVSRKKTEFELICATPHKGAFLAGLCPAPARKLFEKSFLDLQKLLKMGVIKPRPSGEVAAVRLTERASLQGVAPHPTKNPLKEG